MDCVAYLHTPQVSAAVVTCGGLCPGLNDVVQNIVHTLLDYGVPEDNILGIKWVFLLNLVVPIYQSINH